MIKTEEILDIKTIERIRKAVGRTLDSFDNLSWHIALKEGDNILGTGRLYIFKDGVMIDVPCLLKYEESYNELIVRTLLLKAVTMNTENIYADEKIDSLQYGFKFCEGFMKASCKDIIFPKKCGGSKSCE